MTDRSTTAATTHTTSSEPRQLFHSAEHVALEVPIAGPTSRILAYVIDMLCAAVILAGLVVLVLLLTPALDTIHQYVQGFSEQAEHPEGLQTQGELALYVYAVALIAQFALEWFYFVVLELATGGRSIGKAILGLRVCMDGGLPVTPSATVMRNLLRLVDFLPAYYLTGLTSMIVSRDGKRLGDHAAGTIVVRLDRPTAAPPLAIAEEDDPDFRFERAHVAALGGEERALLRQTLRRAETLPAAQRGEAIQRAASVLSARIGYRALEPGEAERFLRALLRASRR